MVGIGLIGTGYWGKNHARNWKEMLKEGMSADEAVMMTRQMERFLSFVTLLPVEHTRICLYPLVEMLSN